MRAAYKTRIEPSRSGRCSCGYRGRSAGQRSVPSGCRVKAELGKLPVNEGRAHKQLVDHPVALCANGGRGGGSRMGSDDQAHAGTSRSQRNGRAIVERSCCAAFWMGTHLIWSTEQSRLHNVQIQEVIGTTSGNDAQTIESTSRRGAASPYKPSSRTRMEERESSSCVA
jgi:hypothetical protein